MRVHLSLSCAAVAMLVCATPALAQVKTFDIPAQPITSAIAAYGRQAGVRIVAPADGLEGVDSHAVHGAIDAREVLRQMIAGSGLVIAEYGDGHVVLRRATPAPTAGSSPAAQTDSKDIVVTGYRASLRSAREIKRRSDAIVDVVAAEDIGQLPDNSATEALARLPGVQIFRNRGEGQAITIRGISQVLTTINGQEAYTGSSRRTLLNSYPAGLIGSIEVYKALTPDLIEGGIGGAVNVELRNPLDFPEGITVAGTLRGSYDDQVDKGFYNADLLVSGHWKTGIGDLGVLLHGSYVRRDYLESYRENLQPQTNAAGQILPTGILIKHPQGRYERPVLTGEVQWRPAYNFGIKLRATNVTDDNVYTDNDLQTNIAAATPLQDVELVPGTSIVKSATFVATANSGPRSSHTRQLLDTTQIEAGADYHSGIATLTTDAVYTLSRIETDQQLFLLAFNQAPTIHADFQSDSKYGGLSYAYDTIDLTDLSQFHVRAFSDERARAKGNGLQWRTDLTLDTGGGFFRSIKTGFRYADRSAHYKDGSDLANLNALLLPMSAYPGGDDPETISRGFSGDDATVPDRWTGYRGSLLGNVDNLAALESYINSLPGQSTLFANGRPDYDPLQAFDGTETSYAYYGQVKYGLPIGGVDVDGVIGARIVNTVLSIDGTEMATTKTPQNGTVVTYDPIHGRQNYLDVDPSASAVVHFTPKLQLRLAWTKTFSRPDFSQLNPSLNLVQVTANSGAYAALATTGNPDLKPIRSTNYDASLEYYYGRAGLASIALFERDVNGFIVDTIEEEQLPGAAGPVQVTKPINAGDGTIKGIELNASTFFDFAPGWLRNFGASANYTRLSSKQVLPETDASPAITKQTEGVSKNSFNASLFYDDGKVRARVAYAYRGGFTLAYNATNPDNDLKWYPITRLDASATYRFGRHVSLTFDATNLLGKPQRAYWGTKAVTDRVYFEGRVYSAALRFKF